jgi:hypothetical protein
MLEFKGDIEQTFQRTFSIDIHSITDETKHYELKQDGDSIPVTSDNVHGFIDVPNN